MGVLLVAGSASATTHYIAANGSDANNGTSETAPWLHAPGMPNCAANCAAYTPAAGDSIIFRGGDTWHFGNSSLSPYTGGTWSTPTSGSSSNCDTTHIGSQTSCIYYGVNQSWYSGNSWTRPILNGDNPTSTSYVSSCSFQTGGHNILVTLNSYNILDNFEITGMCQSSYHSCCGDIMVNDGGGPAEYENLYIHGWTSMGTNIGGGAWFDMTAFSGSGSSRSTIGPNNICDGWDSNPRAAGCLEGGPGYYVYDNVFTNQSQIEMGGCHSWHDNIWINLSLPGDGFAHGNLMECNTDYSSSAGNVFYNNVIEHVAQIEVSIWFTPNGSNEYWFNNVYYDVNASGNWWDVAAPGSGTGNCSPGTCYMFNNTLDAPSAGAANCVPNMTVFNNHEICGSSSSCSAFASGSCSISNETQMSHNTAVTQGYMATAGTSGSNDGITCANDTTPCAPTAPTNSTVTASGTNEYSGLCATMAGTSDEIIQLAGAACENATNDACSYNSATHALTCPGQTANARPSTGAWDAGAYQYSSTDPSTPAPPTGLSAVVN